MSENELAEFLRDAEANMPPFQANVYESPDSGDIHMYVKDDSAYGLWINQYVELMISFETGEIVGCCLSGCQEKLVKARARHQLDAAKAALQ